MAMKCPQCGAWALIKETRTKKDINEVVRRYECGNLHRFSTVERHEISKTPVRQKQKTA